MIRFSPAEAQREKVLLWSLGVDLEQKSVTQIALLFGRGRKLGPVLQIPGSRQQDLWRSLEVVGNDCECGLDRSWMQGPMIPHDWSTSDEAEALAALGFDPGNPLVKAEISRILARGPLDPKQSQRSLEELLPPQMQLGEIDIDALVSAPQKVPSEGPSEQASDSSDLPNNEKLDLVAAQGSSPEPKQGGPYNGVSHCCPSNIRCSTGPRRVLSSKAQARRGPWLGSWQHWCSSLGWEVWESSWLAGRNRHDQRGRFDSSGGRFFSGRNLTSDSIGRVWRTHGTNRLR